MKFSFRKIWGLLILSMLFAISPAVFAEKESVVYSCYITTGGLRQIRMIHTDGTNDQFITTGSWPRMARDHKHLAFLRDGNYPPAYRNNLYTLDITTGSPKLIYGNDDYVVGYDWTTDSLNVVFDYECR